MTRGATSEAVRETAAEREVSERTVWRWLATMRAADSDELLRRPRTCDWCETPLPEGATIRRRFCNGTCRVANHRAQTRRRG